jgi:hypothetical protein
MKNLPWLLSGYEEPTNLLVLASEVVEEENSIVA